MKHSYPTLYLFNNVFFPQTIIPLTLSDKTSIELLKTCHQKDQNIVLYHPSERERKVGTLGRIISIEKQEDNSITALVQGLIRVRLVAQEQHLPYPLYLCEDHYDLSDEVTFLDNSLERLQLVLESWLLRHVSSVKERDRFVKELNKPQKLINYLCMFIIKDNELKEILLENTSLAERIRLLDALLKGKSPDTEDQTMSLAIKNFERLEPNPNQKNAV